MRTGKKIWVELPLEVRAERLAKEYNNSDEFILAKLPYLKKFIDGKVYMSIVSAIAANDRYTAALLLLKYHYDIHYMKGSPDKSSQREYSRIFKVDSFQRLKEEVLDYFTHLTL